MAEEMSSLDALTGRGPVGQGLVTDVAATKAS